MKAGRPGSGYLVKILVPAGYRVLRLEFTRRHIAFAIAAFVASVGTISGYYVGSLRHAEASVRDLRDLTNDQRARLEHIGARAGELDSELQALEHQNDQIRKLIGAGATPPKAPAPARASTAPHDSRESLRAVDSFAAVAIRIERLSEDSARARSEGDRLRGLALRVLNMRRLESLARSRMLAEIPSINPAGNAGIASAFGWRLDPWPEFHAGVDLGADYGDTVRAAAAGTVVAAGWDGGYGIKIDIDHGNGYHTWYCHLSRAEVTPGAYVTKAQSIGSVGSTGASTGPHLHYQIMLAGKAIDPAPYLNGVPEKVLAALK